MTSIAKVNNYSVKQNPVQKTKRNLPEPDKCIEHANYTEYVYKTEASSGKKIGVGIGSLLLPGLGQCINGQYGKGIGIFGGAIFLDIILPTIMVFALAHSENPVNKSRAFVIGQYLARAALAVFASVDAVRNAKTETIQIVPKDDEDIIEEYEDEDNEDAEDIEEIAEENIEKDNQLDKKRA